MDAGRVVGQMNGRAFIKPRPIAGDDADFGAAGLGLNQQVQVRAEVDCPADRAGNAARAKGGSGRAQDGGHLFTRFAPRTGQAQFDTHGGARKGLGSLDAVDGDGEKVVSPMNSATKRFFGWR